MEFVLAGDVNVKVTVTETADGCLEFTVEVMEGEMTADLNGLFFDFGDPDLVGSLTADGADITNSQFEYDAVDNLGGGVNIKGELVNDTDLFDIGVRFGTSGMAKDDIQMTSFTLSHPDYDLSLADIENMDFGVRMTSVGEIDGSRDGSLKIGGTAPEATVLDGVDDPDGTPVDNDIPIDEPVVDEPIADLPIDGMPPDEPIDAQPTAEDALLSDTPPEQIDPVDGPTEEPVLDGTDLPWLEPLTDEEIAAFDEPEDLIADPMPIG
ncbi:hypothetical protein ILP92_03915 [Maribius pontilimi]|uniref:Uncharacterized protein n=1 Tax=Palleronia pontilimi TaxID=1964209 RepID=A0A934IFF7_9RHOB|nr:hypothetical protein [Palleronia pontilimi]MBJ3761893.1 hypothetical protein [Palleronia pontilimi]